MYTAEYDVPVNTETGDWTAIVKLAGSSDSAKDESKHGSIVKGENQSKSQRRLVASVRC